MHKRTFVLHLRCDRHDVRSKYYTDSCAELKHLLTCTKPLLVTVLIYQFGTGHIDAHNKYVLLGHGFNKEIRERRVNALN